MRKFFLIIISISLLIIALSVAYHFIYYLPSVERAKNKIYSDCDNEATLKAEELLKSKIEIAEKSNMTYLTEYKVWKEASNKGLFLKDDYNSYYENCLRRYGIKY